MGAGWERHKPGIVRPFRRLLKDQVRGVGNYGDEVKTGFLKTERVGGLQVEKMPSKCLA